MNISDVPDTDVCKNFVSAVLVIFRLEDTHREKGP